MANYFRNKKGLIILSLVAFALVLYWLNAAYFNGKAEILSMDGVREYRGQDIPDLNELSPEDYPGEMESIIRAIDRWYALKDRKQVDAAELKEEFIPRAENIDTLETFFEVALELFSRLNNPHAQMLLPTYGLPVRAELIEGKPVVTALEEDLLPEELTGKIVPGTVIEKIEDLPAAEWLETRTPYFSSSNDNWNRHGAVKELFIRYVFEAETRIYQFRGTGGNTMEMELTLDLPAQEARRALELPLVEQRNYDETGYIAVNSLTDEVVEEFDAALIELKEKDSLILDLRRCEGGDSRLADEIFRRFIQKEKGVWTGVEGGDRVAEPYVELNYQGKLTILIGPYTFSAAEGLVFDLYDADRGLLLGAPTRGCSGGGPRNFITDGGFMFRFPTRGVDYSSSGLEMEGEGLAPHVEVEQTMENYLKGVDTVLHYALERFEE